MRLNVANSVTHKMIQTNAVKVGDEYFQSPATAEFITDAAHSQYAFIQPLLWGYRVVPQRLCVRAESAGQSAVSDDHQGGLTWPIFAPGADPTLDRAAMTHGTRHEHNLHRH